LAKSGDNFHEKNCEEIMTMNVAIIVFCGMLFWLGILAAGKSAPVLCDWDHDDLSASADSMVRFFHCYLI
jgi:hypothetical protein